MSAKCFQPLWFQFNSKSVLDNTRMKAFSRIRCQTRPSSYHLIWPIVMLCVLRCGLAQGEGYELLFSSLCWYSHSQLVGPREVSDHAGWLVEIPRQRRKFPVVPSWACLALLPSYLGLQCWAWGCASVASIIHWDCKTSLKRLSLENMTVKKCQ